MNARTAREISIFVGWLLLTAAVMQSSAFMVGILVIFRSGVFDVFQDIVMMFVLSTTAAIFLIQRQNTGFLLVYVAAIFSTFATRFNVLPGLKYIVPKGPEADYYHMAATAAVALLLAFCHWQIARELPPHAQKRERTIIVSFAVLLCGALIYWKSGFRVGNGEVAKISETPLIGALLPPLESSQSIFYRDVELQRGKAGTIVFRGKTSEENLRKFAEANELKLLTNDVARGKMFPITRQWKLDPERFPIFTNATDLCYVGRLPKGGRTIIEIALRPGDDRFTALAMKLLPKPKTSP